MAESVFNYNSSDLKVVKADEATITFDSDKDTIATGVQIQFARQVERVPTIGKIDVASVSKPQGTLTANTVFMKTLPNIFQKNACSPDNVVVDFGDGTCDLNGKKVTLENCIASAVTIELQGGRGYVVSGLTLTFFGMKVE